MKKTLALLLALVMCLPMLAACGGSDEPDATTDTATTAATTATADAVTTTAATTAPVDDSVDANGYKKDDLDPSLNYGGETFTILYWKDVERIEFEVENQTGDLIGDALYARNGAVEERLNIDFEWIGTAGNNGNQANFVTQITNDVNSGGTYDVYAGYSMTASTIALQGLSRNLLELEHINLEQPWWPKSLTELTTINDRLYFCSGDISTNMLHMMYCTFFNKKMVDELNIGNLYEMVEKGQWTMDKMAELAATAYEDVNGNTVMDTADKFGLGLVMDIHFDAFFTGAGLRTVTKDANGIPVVAEEFLSDRTQAVLTKVQNMFHDGGYAAFPQSVTGYNLMPFVENRTLFIVDRNYITSHGVFKDADTTYGVLPVPKYDEAQENYYTCMAFPFTIYSISISLDDAEANRAAAVLECMASESYRQVTPAVFETTMKLKYADAEEDADMYDLVRDTIQIDLGRIFTMPLKNITWSPFRSACIHDKENWVSIIKAESGVMKKALDIVVDKLDELAKQ